MLLRLADAKPWSQLANQLDLPASTGTGIVNKLMGVINGYKRSDIFERELHSLAAEIARQKTRISYGGRRDALRELKSISEADWYIIALRANYKGLPTESRRRNGAAWVWSEVTGGDPYLSPALSGGNQESLREVYRRFVKHDLPHLYESISLYALQLCSEIDGR